MMEAMMTSEGSNSAMSLFLFCFLLLVSNSEAQQQLRTGFYATTCPNAELLVRNTVSSFFRNDPTTTPALLRLFFHDCFVRGCDASLLLNSTATNRAEKDAVPNQTVRGYNVIEAAKTATEQSCKGIVSCADILALATRDAIVLAGGPSYVVPTGRRDGRTSLMSEANSLPDPNSNAAQAIAAFGAKGLTVQEMVVLLGAHTVGISHCRFFKQRLFNFRGTGAPDPSMDPSTVQRLQSTCSSDAQVDLDESTPNIVDKKYFDGLVARKGVLEIDQQLRFEKRTNDVVIAIANGTINFNKVFSAAMVRMGNLGVLTSPSVGSIRRTCAIAN